ncbi:ABC transporter permease [Candidatus Poriferisodalis sp.]|uniref:ABC transporter permease n=1 Tax=Candidatus Poriferisodalis sp. TaxID=3101277 RepID=UPI003B016D41
MRKRLGFVLWPVRMIGMMFRWIGDLRRRLGVFFLIAVAYLAVLAFAAVFADILPIKDPAETFAGTSKQGPSLTHWFGNDGVGRDVFSRVIYGAQVSLVISTVGTVLALVIGGLLGMVSGYYSGRVDRWLTATMNASLVIPPLILFLALVLFLDGEARRRIFILVFTFVLLSIAPIARVVRAATLSVASQDFVLAAKTLGARDGRVLFREVLPNVAPSLVSYSLIIMAGLIVVEGSVAFLGLSVPPPTPTWGDMINKGRTNLDVAAHISLMPAIVMFVTVLALNFVGDKLQQYFEPRESVI